MRIWFAVLVLAATARAQSFVASSSLIPDAPQQHLFWTRETQVNAGLLAGLVAADATLTQQALAHGMREANPIMRPFVTRGAAGSAAGSSIGFGTGLGIVYLLHRTNHHKTERVAMRMLVGMESAVVARNIMLVR